MSYLGQIGTGALNVLAGLGNALDLPGSSVRDVFAGRNPFDQWLSPFHEDNRTTGRDLAREYGMAGNRDTWGNFLGGMALETALDPTTYVGIGMLNRLKPQQAVKGALRHAGNPVGMMDDGMEAAGRYARNMNEALARRNRLASKVSTSQMDNFYDDLGGLSGGDDMAGFADGWLDDLEDLGDDMTTDDFFMDLPDEYVPRPDGLSPEQFAKEARKKLQIMQMRDEAGIPVPWLNDADTSLNRVPMHARAGLKLTPQQAALDPYHKARLATNFFNSKGVPPFARVENEVGSDLLRYGDYSVPSSKVPRMGYPPDGIINKGGDMTAYRKPGLPDPYKELPSQDFNKVLGEMSPGERMTYFRNHSGTPDQNFLIRGLTPESTSKFADDLPQWYKPHHDDFNVTDELVARQKRMADEIQSKINSATANRPLRVLGGLQKYNRQRFGPNTGLDY